MNSRVYTVTQVNSYIKDIFDAEELLHDIRISGEVSGFSVSGAHAYFTLKEEGAQMGCTFFRFREQGLREPVRDGDKVIVRGRPGYYVKGGRLSFNVTSLEKSGVGDLYREFLLLKEKLEKEGLFDRKIPMPSVVRRIGVITSKTGAVIHDIVHVATRRDPNIDIVLYPVKVQGIGAAEEIEDAICRLDRYRKVDVIVVARGGGSLEDLAAFNDERVARAVAACKKFIVSAVGHETDFSLSDFCADMRAPTPSAAAEVLTRDIAQVRAAVVGRVELIRRLAEASVATASASLANGVTALAGLANWRLESAYGALTRRAYGLNAAAEAKYRARKTELGLALGKLDGANPVKILQHGYARIERDGKAVETASDLKKGDTIDVRMRGGTVTALVENIRETNK